MSTTILAIKITFPNGCWWSLVISWFQPICTSGCLQRSAGTPHLCHHSRHLQAEIRPQSSVAKRGYFPAVKRGWKIHHLLLAGSYSSLHLQGTFNCYVWLLKGISIKGTCIWITSTTSIETVYAIKQPEIDWFWRGSLNFIAWWHDSGLVVM